MMRPHLALALGFAALTASASAPPTELVIDVHNMRNANGTLHACVTRDPRHFPDCKGDPASLQQSVPANARTLRFSGFDAGSYAVTLFHDENNNRRLDTVLGIPKEGFGFSRNPTVRFGAPKFEQVNIELRPGYTRQAVRMQYLL